MSDENELLQVTVSPEILNKSLFALNGKEYRVVKRRIPKFGGLIYKDSYCLEIQGANTAIFAKAKQVFVKWAQSTIKSWVNSDAITEVKKTADGLETLFEQKANLVHKQYQNEFIRKLAIGGRSAFRDLFTEYIKEVTKAYKIIVPEKSGPETLSTGFMPNGIKYVETKSGPGGRYDLFCFEEPPHRRTITIFGQKRRLAFP